jgi:DNA-binding NarL/FixJ family response regulator
MRAAGSAAPLPVTCVVTDDHDLVLTATTSVLEGAGYSVVDASSTGEDALRAIEAAQPAFAVVDYELPDMTGFELAERVRAVAPQTLLLLHSARLDASMVASALAAGIRGVVVKGSASRLLDAVHDVQEGAVYVDPSLASSSRDADEPQPAPAA